ncbi:MAG: glycosyltransferase family 39 protein [Candidatus Hydrogenedentes bacterium]|nr:glycosyltransferase family 39 protein [Candidatus Hydrogenedentota bacterium]
MPRTENNKVCTDRASRGKRALLAAIIVVAIAVRLFGIHHGMPYGYQIDESFVVHRAVGFGTGDFNPHEFDAPGTTLMYLLFVEYGMLFVAGWIVRVFHSPSDFADLFLTNPTVFFMMARFTSIAFGIGTVYLVYRLGKEMCSRRLGLLAATFFAFSRLAVGVDHFAFFDTPLTFFCALSMLLFYRVMSRGTVRDYMISGFVVGVTIAVKYNGAALAVPFGVAHIYRVAQEKRWRALVMDPRPWLTTLMVIVGFVVCCPFSVLDFKTFYESVIWQVNRVNAGSFGMDVNNAWLFYLKHGMPYAIGIGLTVCSLAGMAIAAVRRRKEELLVASFAFCYLFYIGSWKVAVNKYLMPALPFLALLAALCVMVAVRLAMKKKGAASDRVLIILAVLLVAGPFARSVANGYLLCHTDTRTQAKEWIETHIPAGSSIAIDSGNFNIAKFSPPINDSASSLRRKIDQIRTDPPAKWATAKKMIEQYFEIKLKHASGTGYNLYRIAHTLDETIDPMVDLDWLVDKGVEYIVVSSYAYKIYRDPVYAARNPEKARVYSEFYDRLDKDCRLLKVFQPLSEEGPGPIIKIYEVPHG